MRNTTPRKNSGTSKAPRPPGVQSIARAAALLRALGESPEGLGLGELAAAVELPKPTVHRLIGALAEEDLVDQEPGGHARLGSEVARLAAASRESLSDRLRPLLVGLRRDLDETVDLSVLDGAAVRFVDQVPAPRRLRATSAVGELFPLHCTANGKALLAAMPKDQALALLPKWLPQLTSNTIRSRDAVRVELARIRGEGVAFDREEHTLGICAVGAAICDAIGPVAAISVPVPIQRFADQEGDLAKLVRRAATDGSKLLGGTAI